MGIHYLVVYLLKILYAILNRDPIERIVEVPRDVIKEQVVRVPLQAEHLKHLDGLFPLKPFVKNNTTLEDCAFNAGERSVVEYMKRWSEKGKI